MRPMIAVSQPRAWRQSGTAFKVVLSTIDLTIGAFKVFGSSAGAIAAIIYEAFRGNFGAARTIAAQFFADVDQIAIDVGESWASIWSDAPPIEQAARQTGELAGRSFAAGVQESTERRLPSALEAAMQAANERIQKGVDDAVRAQERLFDALQARGERVFLDTRTEQERYAMSVAELDRLLDAGVITIDTYSRALEDAADRLKKAKASSDDFGESVGENSNVMQDFSRRGAESLFSAFEDYFFSPMDRSFGDLVLDFGRTLARMAADVARQQIIQQLFSSAGAGASAAAAGPAGLGAAVAVGAVSAGASALATRGSALEYHDGASGARNGAMQTRSQALEAPQVNLTNVNVTDPSLLEQMLMTPEGQRAVLNVMRSNKEVLV
jgi:hypothetical protein